MRTSDGDRSTAEPAAARFRGPAKLSNPAQALKLAMRSLADRLRGRADSEHEQILIRIGIGAVIAVILGAVLLLGGPSPALITCLALAVFLLTAAIGILAHLLWKPSVNPLRRCLAMLLDIGCLSVGMIIGGESMTPLYPLFLWVTLGMGFRYGQRYLLMAAAMTLIGFGAVIAVSEHWRSQPLLAGSLFLALIVLPAYAFSLLKKLTEALEKAEESNRTKNRFLATMSHELRTPLNAIFGMADLLEASRLNADQRDMVATMRSAGRTLLELVDDVLEVARIESGRLELREDRFDLHVTLAEVLQLLRHQAVEKGLELRARCDPDTPRIVVGSERSLKQILINLLGNAIKFTDRGEVGLGVRVATADGERAALLFEISDTGIGIPNDAQERIFERFTQADDRTSRRFGGSGLGLSIARQLTVMMGGSLTVTSTVGRGSCFRLAASFATPADRSRRLSGHVAIVGHPAAARAYAARLRSWGAETVTADHPVAIYDDLANSSERRAVLLLGDRDPSTTAAFGAKLRSWFRDELLNLVLIHQDDAPIEAADGFFSVLAADPADDRLFNVMHAALAAPEASSGDPVAASGAGIRRRILVAEDNLINQKVIRKILASRGHAVVLAENGEDLLDKLDGQAFDLAFVDLNMPMMSGMDAVKLHRMGAGTDHPPFVALTADATEETRRACAEIGFAAYLTKPLDMRSVLDVVDRLSRGTEPVDGPSAGKVIRHPRFADGHATIDCGHLSDLRALDSDPAFFHEIVNDFIEDASGLIDELEAAAEVGDDILYRDRNHALQSSAAHIGATGLLRVCQQWRHLGPDQLRREGDAIIAQVRLEFQALSAELRAALAEDGATSMESKR